MVLAGLQLQLITYVDAAIKDTDLIPVAALYYALIEANIGNERIESNEEIEKLLKNNYRMNGVIVADSKVLHAIDNNYDGAESSILPIDKDKRTGKPTFKTNFVTRDEFENLQKYSKKLIKDIAEEIMSGNIKIKPYYQQGKTPCEYCDYKSICQFDRKLKNSYRYIPKKKKDDVFQKIKEDIN